MQKYFAPRRCISCDWANLPNVSYIVSPATIEKRVIVYEENKPKNDYYIVKFPEKKKDGIDFCDNAKIRKIYTNKQECQNRCHELNLAVKKLSERTKEDFER